MIEVKAYKTERYKDGTSEEVQVTGWGCQIFSSKDLFQYDNKDMKELAKNLKKSLR